MPETSEYWAEELATSRVENIATNNMATAMESSISESSFCDEEAVSGCDLPTILDSRDDTPYMFEPAVRENANRPEIPPDSPP